MEINLVIFFGIIFVALVVQYLVEACKKPTAAVCRYVSKHNKISPLISPFLSIIFAVLLCYLARLDLFTAFGYSLKNMTVGYIATGCVASLGADRLYAFLTDYEEFRAKKVITKESPKE